MANVKAEPKWRLYLNSPFLKEISLNLLADHVLKEFDFETGGVDQVMKRLEELLGEVNRTLHLMGKLVELRATLVNNDLMIHYIVL